MISNPQDVWSQGDVFANGIHIHYYRTGGEKPPLVLLHGFTENGLCWSRVARALEQDYDIIMVDARGHGLSSGPEAGYSQELLREDVAGLIQGLRLVRPVVFGYSNGALTAAQLAAAHPELVSVVILEDPPWREASTQPPLTNKSGEPWPGYRKWFNSWIAWHKALRTQTFAERVAASQQFLPPGTFGWSEEDLATHLEAQAQFNLDVLNYSPAMPVPTSWRGTVENIKCPILLITSNPGQRPAISEREAHEIATHWHNGQYIPFKQNSHFLHHEMSGEQFDHFIDVVKTFLGEIS